MKVGPGPRRSTRLNASPEQPMELESSQPTTSTEDDAASVIDCCQSSPIRKAASVVDVSSESETECDSPKSGRNLLKQLDSNLNLYWVPGQSDGRVSRYGRHQKVKEREGFVPTELSRFVSKSDLRRSRAKTPPLMERYSTPPPRQRSRSPVESIRNMKTPSRIKTRTCIEPISIDLTEQQTLEELPNELPSNVELPKPAKVPIAYLSDVDSGRGSSIDFQEAAPYKFGSIYWAKFSVKCWWPCLVCPAPKDEPPDPHKIHVRFFADNGRRAWILTQNLIPYLGLDHLKNNGLKVDMKLKKLPIAITEADTYVLVPQEERLERFQQVIEAEAAKRAAKNAAKAEVRRLKILQRRSATPDSPVFESETENGELPQFFKPTSKRALSLASDTSSKKQKLEEAKEEEKELTVEEKIIEDFLTENFDPSYLYATQMKKEPVCRICFMPGENLKRCEGQCFGFYHPECSERLRNGEQIVVRSRVHTGVKKIKNRRQSSKNFAPLEVKLEPLETSMEVDTFTCFDCDLGCTHCFVCHQSDPDLMCSQFKCGRSYHRACLEAFPQATLIGDKLTCPLHSCHTCLSKDIGNKFTNSNNRLVQCVLCPTSYHYNSPTCILAGTEFITTSQIICTKHPLAASSKVNVNWCFVCAKGGQLICCERCPAAMHATCLQMTDVPEHYICDQCETGQRPLYNEVVWAKMGGYRFWPAICLPPQVAPLNMLEKYHAPGDVCVRFFGSKDYAWLPTDRMFLYECGDSAKNTYHSENRLDAAYSRALTEAQIAYDLLLRFNLTDDLKFGIKPPKYASLRTNLAVPPAKLNDFDFEEESSLPCSCTLPVACGIDSDCLNRTLMQECDPTTCPCGTACQNQHFTQRRYPCMRVQHTKNRGFGLYAGENIVQGAFITEYVGEVIDTAEYRRRLEVMTQNNAENFYFMTLEKNLLIDAGAKGNLARFINHSCDPNCTTEKWRVGNTMRVGLFATRDIKEHEELTFDYQFECIGSNKKPCHCGAANCSGFIGVKKSQSVEKELKTTQQKKRKKKKQQQLKIKLKMKPKLKLTTRPS